MDTTPARKAYLAGLKQGEKMGKGHMGAGPTPVEKGHGPGRSASHSKTRLNGSRKGK